MFVVSVGVVVVDWTVVVGCAVAFAVGVIDGVASLVACGFCMATVVSVVSVICLMLLCVVCAMSPMSAPTRAVSIVDCVVVRVTVGVSVTVVVSVGVLTVVCLVVEFCVVEVAVSVIEGTVVCVTCADSSVVADPPYTPDPCFPNP